MATPANPETQENEENLQHDPAEADSALGSDEYSVLTQSVRSSVYDYRYENGRRYHAFNDGQYLLPNDEREQDRLDLAHHMFKMVLGGSLYTAPIANLDPKSILDIGTGTGIWAIDIADEFPSANVIGTDLSPIQPTWVPPNCQFYVDDAEGNWTFDQKFDYIHGRALAGGIGDWPKYYKQALEHLKPGAWMESQEHACWISSDDDSMERTEWCTPWLENIDEASVKIGKRLDVAKNHKRWMEEAGFTDVRETTHKVPIGSWPRDPKLKELGRYQLVQMIEAVPTYTEAFYTRVLNFSLEQTKVVMEGVRSEFRDRSLHLYVKWHFVCGRKAVE